MICARIAAGENLSAMCDQEDFPYAESTVYLWFRKFPEFSEQYAQARTARADVRADRIDGYRQKVINGEMSVDVAKCVFDMEKWQAGKENPKYSDKPSTVVNNTIYNRPEEDLDREIGDLMGKVGDAT